MRYRARTIPWRVAVMAGIYLELLIRMPMLPVSSDIDFADW
jgi:hypothetical protein